MKICILSRNAELYSTRRLLEAGQARGHDISVIDTLQCYMEVTQEEPAVWYQGTKLQSFDAIIPRIGASITHYGLAVIRQFEMQGIYCLTESIALGRSRDKLRALQLLSRKGIGMPATAFAFYTDATRDLISRVGGVPVVVKLLEGTQGRGVVLAETQKAAESVIDAFRELKAHFLVQEFIREAAGADVRCFVIGNKVVAAIKRTAPEGEFRSNLHCGGVASLTRLSKAESTAAVRSARILGLQVAGVDILRSDRGPLVMEVNSSPGLEGVEAATGKDIAGMIIDYIERDVTKKGQPNKG
jgi:ribosomal protein S6--L-glutamate ligase